MKNITETAIAAGSFTTLLAALQAAELVETLSSSEPFTVFAPSDEAFAKLPPGTIASLLQDKVKLTSILTYHVINGKHMAADIMKQTRIKTLHGSDLNIDATQGVMVGNAKVTQADITCSNGVIHVIDTVLIPAL